MFDLLAVQGILNILLQNHCSNASILQRSPSFMVQLSHVYSTSGKTIALTIWTFGSKAMTLLFNILFRFVMAFLPSSKHLLISWLQSLSAVILDSTITVDIDCSHEIKRCFFLGRKAMTNIDSVFESRDITLLTKLHIVKAIVFPVVMYEYEIWNIKMTYH